MNSSKHATNPLNAPAEPHLYMFSRIATWLHTRWLRTTYPFAAFGRGSAIHYSCNVRRIMARWISFAEDVYLSENVWLNIAPGSDSLEPKIVFGAGCNIGRGSMISSRNKVVLEQEVLFAPNVLIMDHNHEFSNPDLPILAQGVTEGGRVVIERNCWLGYGAVIVCTHGELTIGRNSVIGANAVVTRIVPPFSVVGGNPAKLLRTYDQRARAWVKCSQ